MTMTSNAASRFIQLSVLLGLTHRNYAERASTPDPITRFEKAVAVNDQTRKSRTTKAMNRKVMAAVLVLCVSYLRLYIGAEGLIQAEKTLELSMERANVNEQIMKMADAGLADRAMSPAILLQTIPPKNSLTVPVDYFKGTEYCPLKALPNTTIPFEWAYFQEVAKTNEELAVAARPFSASSPLVVSSKPRIPRRLIFTHQYNLFDCESSRNHLTPTLHMLAANARQTVALYREFWEEPAAEVTFLTDMDCLQVLNETEPRLIKYFKKEKGIYKADICRVAELYINGGYYFDVDLLAVHPVSPADSVGFSTVMGSGWPKNGFFQAFTASAPGPRSSRSPWILFWKSMRASGRRNNSGSDRKRCRSPTNYT